jgi:hypothetical protein
MGWGVERPSSFVEKHVGAPVMEVSIPQNEDRWGVFHIGFARRVDDEAELVELLGDWLPELRRIHLMGKAKRSSCPVASFTLKLGASTHAVASTQGHRVSHDGHRPSAGVSFHPLS